MGDFVQRGTITTLHDLSGRSVAELEADLVMWSATRPMTLLIPSLASEMDGPALPRIIDALETVPYLDEVVLGLDGADARQFERARNLLARLPMRHRILWNDGPRLSAIDDDLVKLELAPFEPGKGRNVWYSLGYFLASGRGQVVALHDADVLTYSAAMVARLFYPVAHPTFGYAFCKGYYFRVGDNRMNGRVSRLLLAPLIAALRQTLGTNSYLDYIESFHYPLAGEYAMLADVALDLRIPFDWGLEVGVLAEVHRSYTGRRICQVDLSGAYDHKHQALSADDPEGGLHRVAIDISKALYRKLAAGGEVLTPAMFTTLQAAFRHDAVDLMDRYHHDAEMNGYEVDRPADEQLIELFALAIGTAGDRYLSRPAELAPVASWAMVRDAVPDIFDRLSEAVEADNQS